MCVHATVQQKHANPTLQWQNPERQAPFPEQSFVQYISWPEVSCCEQLWPCGRIPPTSIQSVALFSNPAQTHTTNQYRLFEISIPHTRPCTPTPLCMKKPRTLQGRGILSQYSQTFRMFVLALVQYWQRGVQEATSLPTVLATVGSKPCPHCFSHRRRVSQKFDSIRFAMCC